MPKIHKQLEIGRRVFTCENTKGAAAHECGATPDDIGGVHEVGENKADPRG